MSPRVPKPGTRRGPKGSVRVFPIESGAEKEADAAMTSHQKSVPPIRRELPFLCVGFGLILLCSFGGSLTGAQLSHLTTSWEQALVAQGFQLVGLATGYLIVSPLLARAGAQRKVAAIALSCAASVVCIVANYGFAATGAPVSITYLFFFALGFAMSYLVFTCFASYLSIYRLLGRTNCIMALAAASSVAIAFMAALRVAGDSALVTLALSACAIVASALCNIRACRAEVLPRVPTPSKAQAGARKPYRLTAYTVSVLVSLGVAWGLTRGLVEYSTHTPDVPTWAAVVARVAWCCVLAGLAQVRKPNGIAFGLFIRLSLAVTGVAMLLMPLLKGSPNVLYPLCSTAFPLQNTAMLLFSLEICQERGMDITRVIPTNYAVLAGSACVSLAVLWALRPLLDTDVAWNLLALLGCLPILTSIPMLPSRGSDATVFTLDKLPEEEGYDDRSFRACDTLAGKYQLSVREKEVLVLLVCGMTRQEIATQLGLSIWTVKDHVSNIYGKTGTHSAKELILLASGSKAPQKT